MNNRTKEACLDLLKTAVAQQRTLSITYGGGKRVLEPHAVGIGRRGQLLLRGFQVSGYSRSSSASGWKLMLVDEISELVQLDQEFPVPRPKYARNDRHMVRILAQV